ncbi:MAG: DUF3226 domain-containing protein [Tunicatimonas sp.]
MPRKGQIQENFDNKLLVEGNDDQHVVWAICKQFQVKKTFDVIDLEGVDNLMEDLLVRPKQADISRLGIVLDADNDLRGQWQQLRDRLAKFGYQLPDSPTPWVTIVTTNGLPQVGIWLMPNNQDSGMIEDFIRFLVPAGDESLALAEETIHALEARSLQRYIPNHHAKALIHTWLAWQEDPGTPLGQAITKKYLTTDNDLCQQFAAWLNRLFNDA